MAWYNIANVILNVMFFVGAVILTNWTTACWGCGDLHEGVWKSDMFRYTLT